MNTNHTSAITCENLRMTGSRVLIPSSLLRDVAKALQLSTANNRTES